MLKHLVLIVALLATASCGGNGDDSQPNPDTQTPSPTSQQSSDAQSSDAQSSDAQSSGVNLNSSAQPSNKAPPQQAPPPQAPRIRPSLAPPPTFLPTSDNVKEAFLAALMTTYYQTPQGPAREQWVAGEQQKVYGIQVTSCSVSTPGTASTCQIQFNGVSTSIKIMLTQNGWRLVP